jgi:predicted ATPase
LKPDLLKSSKIIRIVPLSAEESIELVRQAACGEIEDPDAAEIAARADGNPFFIIETTGMLLPEEKGRAISLRTTLPPTVQAVVAARLDALQPRQRELARRVSGFFVSFDLDELAVVDPGATVDELHELEEAEVLVREEGTVARWRLRHSTLKDVAHASLPKRERVRLHELIAARQHETTLSADIGALQHMVDCVESASSGVHEYDFTASTEAARSVVDGFTAPEAPHTNCARSFCALHAKDPNEAERVHVQALRLLRSIS